MPPSQPHRELPNDVSFESMERSVPHAREQGELEQNGITELESLCMNCYQNVRVC